MKSSILSGRLITNKPRTVYSELNQNLHKFRSQVLVCIMHRRLLIAGAQDEQYERKNN